MPTNLPLIEPTALSPEQIREMQGEIRRRARERNAIILAHNYQRPEVQDVADFVGDSLGLSREAAKVAQDVIVFCGVHFMAETAAILSPDKRVLLPDLRAGCSLADTITAEDVRRWRAEFPGHVAVGYVNTTAAVKAELDYCCTSGNVLDVVDSVPEDRGILFLPDFFLGMHVKRQRPARKIEVWLGECHVHAGINPLNLEAARRAHPGSEVLVHPECGCAGQLIYAMGTGELDPEGIHVASTERMVQLARERPAASFIVATETGIMHRMMKEAPGKTFVAADRAAQCAYMKTITLEATLDALRLDQHHVTVPAEVAARARGSVDRMIALGPIAAARPGD